MGRKFRKFQNSITGAGDSLAQKLASKETLGTAFLKDSIGRGRQLEGQFEGLRAEHEADINNTGNERQQLAAGANSAAQQQFRNVSGPRSFAQNLEQTVRRGKARQGIVNRGEKAIQNQQLKDRLQLMRSKVGRRGALQGAASDAASFRAGTDITQQNASARKSAATAGGLGFAVGGLASGFKDKFNFSSKIDPVQADVGTASADFFNRPGFGDFNIGNVGNSTGGLQFG